MLMLLQGKLTERESLGTVDLLLQAACLVKKTNKNFNIKKADLVQGGQLY